MQLGKLIYLYDDNHISIDGPTDLAFTEDRLARFEAYGWHTLQVPDGNDVDAIDRAIQAAKADPRPSLIAVRTIIGYGAPNRQGTAKAHGEPLGDDELRLAKEHLGWPVEPRFYIPEDVLAHFREAIPRGAEFQAEWQARFDAYRAQFPERAVELARRLRGELPQGWDENLPVFPADPKGMASRAASGKALNHFAARIPELVGGSADLAPSNNTKIEGSPAFQRNTPEGRNFHFGVREHGMGGVVNGMAYHGGLRPFGATFLVFSDYMRPAIRLAALSHLPSIWVFTHDPIGVGEDGPTHQPVNIWRRCAPFPTWSPSARRMRTKPSMPGGWRWRGLTPPPPSFSPVRTCPLLDRSLYSDASLLERGAYILSDMGDSDPDLILMASGSGSLLIVEAGLRSGRRGRERAPGLLPQLGTVQSAGFGLSGDCAARAGESAPGGGSRNRAGLGALGRRSGRILAWSATALRPRRASVQGIWLYGRKRRGAGLEVAIINAC